MMRRYLLFLFITTTLFTCSRDWDNPLEIDEDLKHTPKIVQIQNNSEYDIEIILDYSYSEESTVVLERKIIGGFDKISYQRQSQSTLVDTSFDKESDHAFIYRVRLEKNDYRTAYSSEQTFQHTGILNSPGTLQVKVIELQGVQLEWRDKSGKEEGYKIEKNEGSGYSEISDLPSNSNSYLDAIGGIPPTTLQLSYRVKAYTNIQSSEWKEITTSYSGLGSPTNLRITDTTYYRFTIEWEDNSSIETGYIVERQKSSGGFGEIAELEADVTQYIDRIAEAGVYDYRVRSKKDNLYSISSNEVSHNIQNVMPMEGLVAFYPFDGNANDESGNGNDGTVFGATLTTDRFESLNSAYSFDGIDDYINFDDIGIANFGTSDFTINFWIKKSTTRYEAIITKREICGHHSFWSFTCSEIIVVEIDQDDDATNYVAFTSNTIIANGNWHHIAFIRNSISLKLYVDGQYTSNSSAEVTNISNTASMLIGNGPCVDVYGRHKFNGTIDEVSIYNRALSEEEIQVLYYEGGWGN